MKKLGLALSGGGFRASLYHLGLLRFLRDAGILSQVTHITSVSGGSVTAAHLAFKLLALKPGWTYEVTWVYKGT